MFEKQAGLFLSDGAFFGAPQHVRLNFATTNDHLLEGLAKLAAAANATMANRA